MCILQLISIFLSCPFSCFESFFSTLFLVTAVASTSIPWSDRKSLYGQRLLGYWLQFRLCTHSVTSLTCLSEFGLWSLLIATITSDLSLLLGIPTVTMVTIVITLVKIAWGFPRHTYVLVCLYLEWGSLKLHADLRAEYWKSILKHATTTSILTPTNS